MSHQVGQYAMAPESVRKMLSSSLLSGDKAFPSLWMTKNLERGSERTGSVEDKSAGWCIVHTLPVERAKGLRARVGKWRCRMYLLPPSAHESATTSNPCGWPHRLAGRANNLQEMLLKQLSLVLCVSGCQAQGTNSNFNSTLATRSKKACLPGQANK